MIVLELILFLAVCYSIPVLLLIRMNGEQPTKPRSGSGRA
jgi:hypothetical protein